MHVWLSHTAISESIPVPRDTQQQFRLQDDNRETFIARGFSLPFVGKQLVGLIGREAACVFLVSK